MMINLHKIYGFVESYFRMKGLSHQEKLVCLSFGLRPESPRSSSAYDSILFANLEYLNNTNALCLTTSKDKPMGLEELGEFCAKNGFHLVKRELRSSVFRIYTGKHKVVFLRLASPDAELAAKVTNDVVFARLLDELEDRTDCQTCKNHHGQTYGGVEFVCAVHPYGYGNNNCPDYEAKNRQEKCPILTDTVGQSDFSYEFTTWEE